MKNKWQVVPKRVGRSRKIIVSKFEPEEIFIEFELNVNDPSTTQEAIEAATQLAISYLDEEEKKLRKPQKLQTEIKQSKQKLKEEFKLEITDEGKKLGKFRINRSEDPQFENFIHLWLEIDNQKIYVGYLRKDNGDFTIKDKNKNTLEKYGVKRGKHFRIIQK
ncbi:hypothetical protein CEE45_02520 [Candidatus Heimdallarchaeota archaeon B3_Heim]|nr:MAG: hypothetical protein CEE45_02520 [Candidatus Heimdallarchaeota archaeon B3_Heim]